MKVQEKLDEIMALVGAARTLPMSSSIVINKGELIRLLTELGELLPDDLAQAEAVLSRRDAVLYEATANAERLLTATMEERQRMISQEEVLRQARIEAAEVIRAAQERSERTSREIDEYVDAKLAHLEVSVTNILETVRQGRQRLAEPGLYRELAALPEVELTPEPIPLPRRISTPEGRSSLGHGAMTEWDSATPEWSARPRWNGPESAALLQRQPAHGRPPAHGREASTEEPAIPTGNAEPDSELGGPVIDAAAAGLDPEKGWTPQRPAAAEAYDAEASQVADQSADAEPDDSRGVPPAGEVTNESATQDEPGKGAAAAGGSRRVTP